MNQACLDPADAARAAYSIADARNIEVVDVKGADFKAAVKHIKTESMRVGPVFLVVPVFLVRDGRYVSFSETTALHL